MTFLSKRVINGRAQHAAPFRFVALILSMFLAIPARAQLTTSFYNVTGISAKSLPNAVRLTIQTDGSVYFGGDQKDFINFDNAYEPKATRSFRLRVLGARAKLPAFVSIGQYPFDSAGISVAPAEFEAPYFRWEAPQYEPHVDIELRFYAPVKVRRFTVRPGDYGLRFGNTFAANDVNVEPSQDGRSIIVTVFIDRADARAAEKLRRSPLENQKHRLEIAALSDKSFQFDVLHSPLQSVLERLSRLSGTSLLASQEAEDLDISLCLPDATLPQFLDILSRGYGLNVAPRDNGFQVARGLSSTRSADDGAPQLSSQELPLRRFPLTYLQADRARSLLPDFLLPAVRVDPDNNALLVSASPSIAQKIGDDLQLLDKPRAQVRIEARLWEFTTSEDADFALQTIFANAETSLRADTQSGDFALGLGDAQAQRFSLSLQALQNIGRVRLAARPFIVVASGERGTLFLGQTRYVTVFDGNQVQALQLQIGTSLEVTPRVGAGDQISLDLKPRFSTVDAIDDKTRLPTLGIREFRSSANVRDGQFVLVAGLDSDLDFTTRRRGALTFKTTQRARQTTKSVLLVTARRVP